MIELKYVTDSLPEICRLLTLPQIINLAALAEHIRSSARDSEGEIANPDEYGWVRLLEGDETVQELYDMGVYLDTGSMISPVLHWEYLDRRADDTMYEFLVLHSDDRGYTYVVPKQSCSEAMRLVIENNYECVV